MLGRRSSNSTRRRSGMTRPLSPAAPRRPVMSSYAYEFSIRRLWIIFGAAMVIMFGALLFFGVQIYHVQAADPGRCPDCLRAESSTRARTSSAARTCGNRSAGCSRARSGATAAMSRPTGARTGCTARRLRCATASPAPIHRTPFEALPEPDQARFGSILKREMRTNSYDPRTTDHHRQRPARRRHRGDRRALQRPVHQPHARRPAIARALRDAAERRAVGRRSACA